MIKLYAKSPFLHMRYAVTIALLLAIGVFLLLSDPPWERAIYSQESDANPRPRIENRASNRPATRNTRAQKSPQELLALVYEKYPDLRFEINQEDLPLESPLTDFTAWLEENYPDGIDDLPDELADFAEEDFEWTEEKIFAAGQFLRSHEKLLIQIFTLSEQAPVATLPNYDISKMGVMFSVRQAVTFLELSRARSIAKGEAPTATDHYARAIAGLALHGQDLALDSLIGSSLFQKSLETAGISPLDLIPSFDEQTASAIDSVRHELVVLANVVSEWPTELEPFDEGSPGQISALRSIQDNPEQALLAYAEATQAQLEAYRAAAQRGERLSGGELNKLFMDITKDRLGGDAAEIVGYGVLSTLSKSQTHLALSRDEAATHEALFIAASDGKRITSLDQLVPRYLPHVPFHRETGEAFSYDAESSHLSVPIDMRNAHNTETIVPSSQP